MDIQSSIRDHGTPLPFKNISFCKTEDSGYHTFTSPLLECSSISNDSSSLVLPNYCKIQVDCYPLTPSSDLRAPLTADYKCHHIKSCENTPIFKRNLKRPYEDNVPQNNVNLSAATPTTIIANEVQKLQVNETKFKTSTVSSDPSHLGSLFNDIYKDYYGLNTTNPTTPIKRVCRSNCHLSPFNRQRAARKVDFAIHSLSCEKQIIKAPCKPKEGKPVAYVFKPNQKVDIIKLLYNHENYFSTSIQKITSYLSQEDIYNFTLVSPLWCNIFKYTQTKQSCHEFFENVKSNLENWEQGEPNGNSSNCLIKPLKEIQNVNVAVSTPRSPIRSPRTTRFIKFTKAASLDDRSQLTCVKCRHPAKVTIESNGEEWVECISFTCAHQFCKLCKSERHPGKSCVQYDLVDGPSPSKRKKNMCPVSSNRSKKKLKRLLF